MKKQLIATIVIFVLVGVAAGIVVKGKTLCGYTDNDFLQPQSVACECAGITSTVETSKGPDIRTGTVTYCYGLAYSQICEENNPYAQMSRLYKC